MSISKRKNRKNITNLQRSKKGGEKIYPSNQKVYYQKTKPRTRNVIPEFNKAEVPPSSNTNTAIGVDDTMPKSAQVNTGQEHIVVILCKLSGDVPAKANELSTTYDQAPIYFGWCPFNVQSDNPYDLIKEYDIEDPENFKHIKKTEDIKKAKEIQRLKNIAALKNIETLKKWGNVDHTDFEQSVILERWLGVTTDPHNSTAFINFLHNIPDVTWPTFKLPKKIVPPYKSKQNNKISDFYMKRIAYLLNFDITQGTDYFTTFLKRFVSTVNDTEDVPIFESFSVMKTKMDEVTDPDPEKQTEAKKKVLDNWALSNGSKVFKINFDGLDATAMKEEVFKLLKNINTKSGKSVKADSIEQTDIEAVYGNVYKVLPITEMFCGALTLSYRIDNFFKQWIDEIPEEPPLVTTDGCAAMAIVAIDILQKYPTNNETQKNYMLEMASYDSCGVREWSVKLLKPLFSDNMTQKSSKCVHVIVDMEADDLFALRILAHFYSKVVVYIASNTEGDNALFNLAKAYLETNMPSHITIHLDPVVCHSFSPNPKAMVAHYKHLYEETNTTMEDIIRHIAPESSFIPKIEQPSLVARAVGSVEGKVVNGRIAPAPVFTPSSASQAPSAAADVANKGNAGLTQSTAIVDDYELTGESDMAKRDADAAAYKPGLREAAINAWQSLTGSAKAKQKDASNDEDRQGGSKRKKSRRNSTKRRNLTRRRKLSKRRKSSKRRNSRKRRKSRN